MTARQREAVFSGRAEVFVTAGAGSGKTRLLVERYLYLLLEREVPLSQLVTVSFTRKAASELKDRIRRELMNKGKPALAWQLDDAPIGTIHSLCARLLRTHPVAAGVDPSFVVMDEILGEILLREAVSAAWEERLNRASPEELDLVAREGTSLRDDVARLYSALRQEGWDPVRLRAEPSGSLEDARARMEEAAGRVQREVGGMDLKKTAKSNLEKTQELLEWLPDAEPTWEAMERIGGLVPGLSVGKAEKPYFTELKEEMLLFRSCLGEHYLGAVADFPWDLLAAVDEEYRSRKRQEGVLDYTDLELGARNILNAAAPIESAGPYLLVDEFQDTNRLQCEILVGLRPASLLTVGDEHQSIYAFRGADVEVFRDRGNRLRRAEEEGSGGEVQLSELRRNFRSRPPLLEAINHIFGSSHFFAESFLRLEPGEDEDAQTCSEQPPDGCSPAMEIDVIRIPEERGEGETVSRLEARAAAARIGRLVEEDGRRYGEIVVLLRWLTKVAELEAEMLRAGIPTYVVQGRGYFDREELTDVLALLKVLVNPRDDVALVTVLRSPLVGISDDTLGVLSQLRRGGDAPASFWEVLCIEEDLGVPQRESRLLEELCRGVRELRRSAGSPGLASLIEEAVNCFGYDLALLSAPAGVERLANIRKLMQLADDFEDAEGPDLGGFVRHMQSRKGSSDREGNAATLGEEDDVVRVMTVHQAKGLEFPVVVMGEAGHEGGGGSSRLEMDRRGRVGWRARGPGYSGNRGSAYITLGPYQEIKGQREQEAKEESDRLHYVALTRAEERVLVIGSLGKQDSDSFLGKLLAVVGGQDQGDGDREDGEEPLWPVPGLDLAVCGLAVPSGTPGDKEVADERSDALPAFVPPALPAVGPRSMPAAVSFSDLKVFSACPRRYYLERLLRIRPPSTPGSPPPAPERGGEEGAWGAEEVTAALDDAAGVGGTGGIAKGLAVHAVLERISLESPPSDLQISSMLEEEFEAQEEKVSPKDIHRARELVKGFWRSPYACAEEPAHAEKESRFVFTHDDVLVTGVMDLLAAGPSEWLVVDYKTNRLTGTSPAEAAAEYELQAGIYSLAGFASGAQAVTVGLLFLEEPEEPVVFRYEQGQEEVLQTKLEELLGEMRKGDFPPDPQGCRDCPFRALCGDAWTRPEV